MKDRIVIARFLVIGLAVLAMIAAAGGAHAQDSRQAMQKAEAAREREAALAHETEQQIFADRAKLMAEVERLEAQQAELEKQLAVVQTHIDTQDAQREKLADRWAGSELQFKEISGNVRLAAKDVETLVHESPLSADRPDRLSAVSKLVEPGYFPDIDDISGLTRVLFDEIVRGGQVRLVRGTFIGRDGQPEEGKVLTLGKFTAAYKTPHETGFLDYAPETQQFVALSTLPGGGVESDLEHYFRGESARVPVDISAGTALRQVSHAQSLTDHLRSGGPIVWPILGLALLALIIVIYKVVDLSSVQLNTTRLMGKMTELAESHDWKAAEDLIARGKRSPVVQVLSAGLAVRHEDRETQESVLQESILHELPRVERGMAVLAVLGAVAPLLGLLGTVTGMISTFHVITLYGTGDPKLMSGGISEALVTTELGLAVSIPILLLHTFLSRRVDHIVGEMEERAVQLTNIFQKQNAVRALVARGDA